MKQLAFHSIRNLLAPQQEELLHVVKRVMDSGWYVMGPEVEAFEQEFSNYIGRRHMISVGNGTDALILALRALGVTHGDRVATVANAGFYASVAILACGAEPVYIDVAAGDFLPAADALDEILDQQLRVVIVTHLYGRMAPVEHLVTRCRQAGVALIEDCAQAHGARRNGRMAGSFGDVGCFSFYPTKNLGALGDGGAVLCDDPELAHRLRALRQYGWAGKYEVSLEGGINSRMDAIQAAILRHRLPRLDEENDRRRSVMQRYLNGIRHPGISLPVRGRDDDVAHLFVLQCTKRDALRSHLARSGINTEVHYPIPDHRQPAYAKRNVTISLPNTDAQVAGALSLPCHPSLQDDEIQYVIEACNRFES